MWIIASLPFWVLGGLLFLAAAVWTTRFFSNRRSVTDRTVTEFGVATICFAVSGVLFIIAAKVAS